MRPKERPRRPVSDGRAGKSDSIINILAHPFPKCKLRDCRIVDSLPETPCPWREPNPLDALFIIKDRAFRKMPVPIDSTAHEQLQDLRTYDTCTACIERINSCGHHREHIRVLREKLASELNTPVQSSLKPTLICDEPKSPVPLNGNPMVTVSPYLRCRRRKPAHAK